MQEKLHRVCLPELALGTYFTCPQLADSEIVTDEGDLLALACVNSRLQGNWHRLYTSSVDGRSFNRVVFHLMGYEGPTCILITTTTGVTLGAFSADPWKDSNRFHGTRRIVIGRRLLYHVDIVVFGLGSRDNFLFSLSPDLHVYKTTGREASYQWLNTVGHGLPHGLGFGGSKADSFRLFVPDGFSECIAIGSDMTYGGRSANTYTCEILY